MKTSSESLPTGRQANLSPSSAKATAGKHGFLKNLIPPASAQTLRRGEASIPEDVLSLPEQRSSDGSFFYRERYNLIMRFTPYFSYLKDSTITWFNPCWGYHGFWKRLAEFQKERKINFSSAWAHRDMKKNKELYASALAALCMQQDAPAQTGWWFTKPPQDPPDGLIGTVIEDKIVGGNIMNGREIEVVEFLGGSLIKTIKNKLSKKRYEPNTILVCLLSPTTSIEIFDFKNIANQLSQISLPLAHIFVVGHGMQIKENFSSLSQEQQIAEMLKVFFIQLSPQYGVVSVSPNICCESFRAGKEQAWLRFSGFGRGVGLSKVKVDKPPELFI